MCNDSQVLRVQRLLDRHGKGEPTAREELIAVAFDQLTRLARVMVRRYPGVHRWEETDDILQGASLRLCRALAAVTIKRQWRKARLALHDAVGGRRPGV